MKVQTCLLYNGTAFPLRDFPEDVLPQSGDKCLLIRDKNLCIPVYSAVSQNSLGNGLMAYWSFNEGAGADTVSDAVGRFPMTTSGHLGIMGGRSGIVGGGWTSNSNSYDGLLSNVSIDPGEYASEFTLNIWFWIPGGQTEFWRRLIGIRSSSGSDLGAFGIFADQDGHIVFAPSDGRSSLWDDSINYAAGSGEWIMVTGVFNNGSARLYKNGTPVASGEALPQMTSPGIPVLLYDVNGQPGMVEIDEAGFWKRALSESEIAFLFNNGRGRNPITNEEGTDNPGISEDGLILYLPLDSSRAWGGDGGWSLQRSYSGAEFSVQDGIPCLSKTNSYGAWNVTPTDRLPTGETPFTISFWSKCDTEGSVGDVETFNITFGASNGTGAFYLGASATNFTVNSWASESTMKAIGTVVDDGTKWHHYIFRYTETGGELWIDGKKKAESSGRYSINPQYCTISGRYWANHGAAFTGAMSNLRIYGRAVSETEIRALANEFISDE